MDSRTSVKELHRSFMRDKTASASEALHFALTYLGNSNIAVPDASRLSQPSANLLGFTTQCWASDDHASILHSKVEHPHVADIAAKLRANAVKNYVIGDVGRAVTYGRLHFAHPSRSDCRRFAIAYWLRAALCEWRELPFRVTWRDEHFHDSDPGCTSNRLRWQRRQQTIRRSFQFQVA